MTLHLKVAKVLGWSESEVASFSLCALRELLWMAPGSKLRDEVIVEIERRESTGAVIVGSRLR